MFEFVLHAATQHPSLTWIIIPSVLSFLAGLGIGLYSDRLGTLLSTFDSTPE